MPLRIATLAYPLMIAAVQFGKPSATAAFEDAGAVSAETSRKADSLRVPRKALARAVKKGLVVPVGDGRYYIDRAAVKRSDRRTLIITALGLLSAVPLIWILW